MGLDPRSTTLAKALLRVAELREASWSASGGYTKTEEACRAEAWAASGLTTPWLGLIELLLSNTIRVASLEWAKMTLAADAVPTLIDTFRAGTPEQIATKLETELAWRRESGEDDPETGVMYKGVSFR